jgi:signal transduction histidine kinase
MGMADRMWWRAEPFVDGGVAAFIAVIATFGTWAELGNASRSVPPGVPAYVLAVSASAVLVARRRHPVLVTLAALALIFGYHVMGYPGEAPGISLFIALYSVAAWGRTARALPLAIVLTGVASTVMLIEPHALSWNNPAVYGPTIGMLWVVVLGATVRRRRVDAEERVRQARAVAEADLRRRLTEDRLRIARELHDVLAHTISVIAIQGGLALDALDDSPEVARRAVLTMRGSAREALAELRAALSALRGEGDPAAPETPQPHLADLPALADSARAAGLSVEVDMDGTDTGVPPVVELTAYRIVQEALTNAVRHSGAASVWVALRREPDALRVEVSDDGRGLPDSPPTGMGLRGMRERAESLGGHLTLATRPGGGCRLEAELPL